MEKFVFLALSVHILHLTLLVHAIPGRFDFASYGCECDVCMVNSKVPTHLSSLVQPSITKALLISTPDLGKPIK